MTPERWHRIEQIYHAAMERGATDRASFLEQECAGDETLRRQIVSLIAAGEQESDFLNAPALEISSEQVTAKLGQAPARSPNTSSSSLAQLLIGSQIGNYRILSQLGAGGMGEVFLARDARLDRKVAIKMLPAEFT